MIPSHLSSARTCNDGPLSESQWGMVAARLATLSRGANQHVEISTPSQDEAAMLLNVSRHTVMHARKVQRERLQK